MMNVETLTRRFERVFTPPQATALAEVIIASYSDLVKTSDFNELKAIVKDLAEAQKRTEVKVGELVVAQERTEVQLNALAAAQERTEVQLNALAAAQERTEVRLNALAVAQERTEARLDTLAAAQERTEARLDTLAAAQERLTEAQERTEASLDKLTQVVTGLGQELGGLSRSVSYALENEAYRALPAYLQARHGLTLDERIVRTEIEGQEINFFARGRRNGSLICLVGETKLQLDERRTSRREAEKAFAQLDNRAEIVQKAYPDCQVVRLLITHYARPSVLKLAQERGILLVQSFEW
ncbi:MAG: hypothetical protein AB1791_13180 [Chloroflexota bacterium]